MNMELVKYYGRILRRLEQIPIESKYRQETEKIIKGRKALVESNLDPLEIERKIGPCEELLEQAKSELKLIEILKDYKPWEPLSEKPPKNQWKWPL